MLGECGLEVSELGLGCAAMAGNHRPVAEEDNRGALEAGLDGGMTFVDTAPFYGAPQAEAVEWPGSFPFKQTYDYSYDGVMRSYEDSLQRLGLDHIDALLLHDIGEMQHGAEKNTSLMKDAMSGGYKALDELRRNGNVKAIGLGVNEKEVCIEAMRHGHWDAFLLAGRYTLLEQSPIEDLFPACAKAGTGIILGGPFNSGILAGGNTWNYSTAPSEVIGKAARVQTVCASHNIPLPAAALQMPVAHPLVATVIPGPRSRAEVQDIFDWWNLDIPASLWSDLIQFSFKRLFYNRLAGSAHILCCLYLHKFCLWQFGVCRRNERYLTQIVRHSLHPARLQPAYRSLVLAGHFFLRVVWFEVLQKRQFLWLLRHLIPMTFHGRVIRPCSASVRGSGSLRSTLPHLQSGRV